MSDLKTLPVTLPGLRRRAEGRQGRRCRQSRRGQINSFPNLDDKPLRQDMPFDGDDIIMFDSVIISFERQRFPVRRVQIL